MTQVAGEDCPRLLVAGRTDRGHPTAASEDIKAFREKHGYKQFISTRAKIGQGIKEVHEAIRRSIPWERLPVTRSPNLWKIIQEYLVPERKVRFQVGWVESDSRRGGINPNYENQPSNQIGF